MIKKFVGLIAILALSGCATTYTYDGKKYDSNEKFQQAVDSSLSGKLSTITPLPTPLTQKKLLFAIPSEATLVTENVNRFTKINGKSPNAQQNEIFENLSKSTFKNIKVFFDAVQKKNIYSSVQFIEMQSMTASFPASADTDTLYFVEASQGAGQWFYTSLKHGKQIFAYDRSNRTPEGGGLPAFVDAVQAQAIRD